MSTLISNKSLGRIFLVLRHTPSYAKHLEGPQFAFVGRAGRKTLYPAAVHRVAEHLAKCGLDASVCSRDVIIAVGLKLEKQSVSE